MQADEEAEQDELPLGLPAPGDEHDPVEDAMDAAMATTELGGFRVPFSSHPHSIRMHASKSKLTSRWRHGLQQMPRS